MKTIEDTIKDIMKAMDNIFHNIQKSIKSCVDLGLDNSIEINKLNAEVKALKKIIKLIKNDLWYL